MASLIIFLFNYQKLTLNDKSYIFLLQTHTHTPKLWGFKLRRSASHLCEVSSLTSFSERAESLVLAPHSVACEQEQSTQSHLTWACSDFKPSKHSPDLSQGEKGDGQWPQVGGSARWEPSIRWQGTTRLSGLGLGVLGENL